MNNIDSSIMGMNYFEIKYTTPDGKPELYSDEKEREELLAEQFPDQKFEFTWND
jgi:hypothetical protein